MEHNGLIKASKSVFEGGVGFINWFYNVNLKVQQLLSVWRTFWKRVIAFVA